jgi:valyl-tRNA synthetase
VQGAADDAEGADRDVARAVLVHAFDQALRLLHPVMPFITESLWRGSPREESEVIGKLARATVTTASAAPEGAAAHALLYDGSEVVVQLAGLVDLEKECARVSTELAQLEKQLGALEQRLANESFVSRAKPEIVEAERTKLGEWTVRREQLASKKRTLCGA